MKKLTRDAPLRDGLILLVFLAALAIPLALLTAKTASSPERDEEPEGSVAGTATEVQLVSSQTLKWFELRRGAEVLARIEGPLSEEEFEVSLSPEEDLLVVAAEFENSTQSAISLEFWPEGLREKEVTFWGEGFIEEQLSLTWPEAKLHHE